LGSAPHVFSVGWIAMGGIAEPLSAGGSLPGGVASLVGNLPVDALPADALPTGAAVVFVLADVAACARAGVSGAASAVAPSKGTDSRTAAITTMDLPIDRNLPGGCIYAPPRGDKETRRRMWRYTRWGAAPDGRGRFSIGRR
jgi:hypothetical protein